MLKRIIKQFIPQKFYRFGANVYHRLRFFCRPNRKIHWGNLRRLTPVSKVFGLERGTPICRYYIARFLRQYQDDIRGRVLEIADATYTREFGKERVVRSDVLHAVPGNSSATIIGDLTTGKGIPQNTYDCIILTQTLPFIYDIHAVIQHIHAALKPGGVVLSTCSGISQVSRYDMDRWGDYWRLTDLSARRLFEEKFSRDKVIVETYGNVMAATAYLHGISSEELTADELEYRDPDYQLMLTVRAVKE